MNRSLFFCLLYVWIFNIFLFFRSISKVEAPSREEISTKKKWGRMVYENGFWLFAISCVIAALTDHMFFYILYIDENELCVRFDKKLKNAALISRSLTYIPFIVDMIYQIYKASKFVSKAKLQTGRKLKTCEYLEHVRAIAKK